MGQLNRLLPPKVLSGFVVVSFLLIVHLVTETNLLRNGTFAAVATWSNMKHDNMTDIVRFDLNLTNVTAGFIHIGKTGGSTLAGVIRNSCHSFMRLRNGTCRNKIDSIPNNETIASELVTSYYHFPDIDLIPRSHHDFYYVSVRDPYERFVSAFAYIHPRNRRARRDGPNGMPIFKAMRTFACFPTLEKFAMDLGGNATISKDNCTLVAREGIKGNIKDMTHLYGNYQRYVAPIPKAAQALFVVRTKHLWNDWIRINKMLDPSRDVAIPYGRHERNVQNINLPVSRNVTTRGRDNICKYLREEYRIYFDLLQRAINMNATDIQEAHSIARANCPNADIDGLISNS